MKQHEKDQPNSFIMFENDKRESESAPHYTGKYITPDGKEMRIAGWIKKFDKDGVEKTLIGGKVTEKFVPQAGYTKPEQNKPVSKKDDSDDLPF